MYPDFVNWNVAKYRSSSIAEDVRFVHPAVDTTSTVQEAAPS